MNINEIKNLRELFDVLLNGNESESRRAARATRKLVYSAHGKSKEIVNIIKNAAGVYSRIAEEFRQENFVMAISVMYFLHDLHHSKAEPDFLFPWLFQLLQHKNGNIRHAAVRMIDNDLGPLTVHIRCPGQKGIANVAPQKADQILFGLRTNLNNLLDSSWKPSYKKYKYINDLPSSTYKSVQLILGYLDDCYEERIFRESISQTS